MAAIISSARMVSWYQGLVVRRCSSATADRRIGGMHPTVLDRCERVSPRCLSTFELVLRAYEDSEGMTTHQVQQKKQNESLRSRNPLSFAPIWVSI